MMLLVTLPVWVHVTFGDLCCSTNNAYGHFRQSFLATTCFRVMEFCVHLQVDKMYCVNENKDANPPHFAFFYKFSIFPSVTPI